MTVLITGGTGFIGAHVAEELLSHGSPVAVFDVAPKPATLIGVLGPARAAEVTIRQGDILDSAALDSAVRDFEVDRIVHLAGLLTVQCQEDPRAAISVNCEGMANVLEIARHRGLARVAWASSGVVFGGPERHPSGVVGDEAPHFPESVYAACKSFNERLAAHYHRSFALDVIGIRPALVFGAGRTGGASQFVRDLLERAAHGQPATIHAADAVMRLQYVRDTARALALAALGPPTQTRVFNTGAIYANGHDLTTAIRTVLPDAQIRVLPGGDDSVLRFDASGIARQLGFELRYSLLDGVRETLLCYRRESA